MPAKQTPKTAGFTIIETLIVIAVAGLIFLMVFLAVPTLERNSRNNQRKQDVQTILEGVSHYELNNSGDMPSCGNPTPLCTANNQPLQYTSPHYYDSTNITVNAIAPGISEAAQTDLEKVDVYNHQKCADIGTASSQGAGYYDVVALYAIETSGGTASRCQQL